MHTTPSQQLTHTNSCLVHERRLTATANDDTAYTAYALIYSTCPVDAHCIFLLWSTRCDSKIVEDLQNSHPAWPPGPIEVPVQCSSFGSASTLDLNRHSLVRDKHLSPQVREAEMSMYPFAFSSPSRFSISCPFTVPCASRELILTACFSPQSAEFSWDCRFPFAI